MQTLFIYQEGGQQTVIVARKVSEPEANEQLSWQVDYSPLGLLQMPPSLITHVDENGARVGILTVMPSFGKHGTLVTISDL